MGHSRPFFSFIFVVSNYNTADSNRYKFCRWLDANRGPLDLEATALPTEAQQLFVLFLLFLSFASNSANLQQLILKIIHRSEATVVLAVPEPLPNGDLTYQRLFY